MRVELCGLPGVGKSSLQKSLIKRLHDNGFAAEPIAQVAQRGIDEERPKTRFIRSGPGRTLLYGCTAYANKHPEIFHLLSNFPVDDIQKISFNLDYLARLHFAEPLIEAGDMMVLSDEGLLHRGVATFNGRNDLDVFERYLTKLPTDLVCLHLDMPVRAAIRRHKLARKRMPYRRGFEGRPPSQVAQITARLLRHALTICAARGMRVIQIDAQQDMDRVVDEAFEQLTTVWTERQGSAEPAMTLSCQTQG